MRFNVVTGLPRSGSTLLCNILNQNPEFYASSTSPLPEMLAILSNYCSNAPEFRGLLIDDSNKNNGGVVVGMLTQILAYCANSPEFTSMSILDAGATSKRLVLALHEMVDAWYDADTKDQRLERGMRAFASAWYSECNGVVFDKGRGWANNALMLNQLFPDALMLLTVRDLRSVFGSIEKQHQKNPILDGAQQPQGKTLYTRADQMFSPEGLIGGPLFAIEDLVRRKPQNVLVIQYEEFAANPKFFMDKIYQKLKMEPFDHDFENVENVADDVDELYLGKFEHKGEGKVEPVPSDEWKDYVSGDLGQIIFERYPFFNKAFSYTQ